MAGEIGDTGLVRYAGYVREEFLTKLAYPFAARVYREMRDNDPVIGAILFAIEMLVRQTSWRVIPADGSMERQGDADFLSSCLIDMSHTWEDLLAEILSMLPFGYSFHELVYKVRDGDSRDPSRRSRYVDGRIGWRKIPVRAQESLWRWQFDASGGVQAMEQRPPADYQLRVIPIEKALLFRPTSWKGSPEGRSVLRNAYRPWFHKKRIEEIEIIGIERDLAGLPVAEVPPQWLSSSATADEKTMLASVKSLVTRIRRDEQEGVVWPRLLDEDGRELCILKLLSTGGRRQFDTNSVIQRYDQRIAMTTLADFVLIGHERVGSFALMSSKTSLFAVALGSYLDAIAEVFNRYAVPRLFAMNGCSFSVPLPRIAHGDIETPDLAELADYVTKLAGAGVLFPTPDLEAHLRSVAGLPAVEETAFGSEQST